MKEKLKVFCKGLMIEHVGIAPIGPYIKLEEILKNRMGKGYVTGFEEEDIKKRVDPKETMRDVASVIVCLFPYCLGHIEEGNIAKYARSLDYHLIVKEKLDRIGRYLQEEIDGFSYESFVDTGPLVDRYLAYLSGLGYFGINNQLITDDYGSYVSIGYILNNYPFEIDEPLDKTCIQCGKCIKKCPGGAILGEFQLDPRKCLSFITQKKELNIEERDLLNKNSMVFGCDICQDICPHNRDLKDSLMKEFQIDLVHRLEEEEILEMSNKAFKRKYGDRAFSWRGRKIIARNIEILREKNSLG